MSETTIAADKVRAYRTTYYRPGYRSPRRSPPWDHGLMQSVSGIHPIRRTARRHAPLSKPQRRQNVAPSTSGQLEDAWCLYKVR